MIGRTVDRFRILALLGEGGAGAVWRAEDTLLNRQVALKLPSADFADSPKARERFMRGARAASMLDHPGIATVYQAGEYAGGLYIAMALIDGETIRQRAEHSACSVEEAVRVGVAAAEALGHAHSRGVTHRDVSGGNIMIAHDGRIFVVDFGLAVIRDHTRLTSTGNVIGTLAYIAPETLLDRGADSRTDLYGLGAVLYHALTGTVPFRATSLDALQYQVLNQAPEPPSMRRPEIPAWLDHVVIKLLAKPPEQRYQNAGELISALRAGASDPGAATGDSTVDLPRTANPEWAPLGMPTLAVLPFRDLALGDALQSESHALFARGLAEVVRASLSRVPDMRVVASTGSTALTAGGDLRDIARHLGASLLLTGTIRRSGTQVRLTFTLMDVARDIQIAAETIECSTAGLFALEDRLIESVRRALDLKLDVREMPRPVARDPAAHERYLQALGYLQRYESEASVDGAIGVLESLIASEGDSASVHATLGRAYLHKHTLTSESRWAERAAIACQAALRLDPRAPEVLVTQGEIHNATGTYAEAIRSFRMALDLRRDDPEALAGLSIAYEESGDFSTAEELCRRVIAVRPETWSGYNRLGVIFFRQGQYARAVEPWRMVTRLTPDNSRGYVNLGAAYFQMGRYEDARLALQRAIAIQPTAATAWTNLGTVHLHTESFADAAAAFEKAVALKPAEARLWGSLAAACEHLPGGEARKSEALEHAIALVRARLDGHPGSAEDWAWLANWYADLGDRDAAYAAVGRAVNLSSRDVSTIYRIGTAYNLLGDRPNMLRWIGDAVRSGFGVGEVLRDPDFVKLRDDAEFRDMLERSATSSSGEE